MTDAPIRVAIVADSAELRDELSSQLSVDTALVTIGSFAGIPAFNARAMRETTVAGLLHAHAATLAPDVIVWVPSDMRDANLRSVDYDENAHMDGEPFTPFVVVVDRVDAPWTRIALRIGAGAVVTMETDAEQIAAAVRAVAAGLTVLPTQIATALGLRPSEDVFTIATNARTLSSLTSREQQVLALLAEGLPNKAIAPRLGIAENTVKAHVAAIYEKVGAGNRAEAVVAAARLGLLML